MIDERPSKKVCPILSSPGPKKTITVDGTVIANFETITIKNYVILQCCPISYSNTFTIKDDISTKTNILSNFHIRIREVRFRNNMPPYLHKLIY